MKRATRLSNIFLCVPYTLQLILSTESAYFLTKFTLKNEKSDKLLVVRLIFNDRLTIQRGGRQACLSSSPFLPSSLCIEGVSATAYNPWCRWVTVLSRAIFGLAFSSGLIPSRAAIGFHPAAHASQFGVPILSALLPGQSTRPCHPPTQVRRLLIPKSVFLSRQASRQSTLTT